MVSVDALQHVAFDALDKLQSPERHLSDVFLFLRIAASTLTAVSFGSMARYLQVVLLKRNAGYRIVVMEFLMRSVSSWHVTHRLTKYLEPIRYVFYHVYAIVVSFGQNERQPQPQEE